MKRLRFALSFLENREQRTENREQRTENREQRTENKLDESIVTYHIQKRHRVLRWCLLKSELSHFRAKLIDL